LIYWHTIRHEEQNLLARFGEPYAAYCRLVGPLWPKFGGLKKLSQTLHLEAQSFSVKQYLKNREYECLLGVETTILDITDADAVRSIVKEKDIQCIVNCAAYTNVDKAESDEALCRKLNADALKILAEAMKKVNGLLIQISTDYVFGGDPYNTPCRENQKGTPTGVYGKTKLEGEQNIEVVDCDYVIIRTAWLYSEYGRNFVKTMLNLTATKPKLTVVFDQAGTPTYAYDLAVAIKTVLSDYEKENPKNGYSKRGIYHFSNEGVCSWYDFTVAIHRLAGITSCKVKPLHTAEYPAKANRPAP
jgi:dTDP-4-dehydrorhamnose reductase